MVVYDTPEEQEDAANNHHYRWDIPNPNQVYSFGCSICAHKPGHFNPPPARCQKCGIYAPKT